MGQEKFWTSEKFIGLSAMFISLCTLILFVYEINITRRQQYASVLPYLQIRHIEMHYPTYKLSLINDGLGPAIIKSIKVINNGKEFLGDPSQYIIKSGILAKDTTLDFSMSNIYPGRLIPAGKQIDMITALGDMENAERLSNLFNNSETTIEIEYESVYEERWVLSGMGKQPTKK
jgi:hypothetical protein